MEKELLLTFTPDELFEKFPLSEISKIKNVFANEIKGIREHLRKIINEKYADFIETTEKVKDMKILANDICTGVGKINAKYLSIIEDDDGTLAGVDNVSICEKEFQEPMYVAAALIKLFLDSTQEMWHYVDQDDYISATIILQFCGHIKTVLEIHTNLNVKELFPILYQQWDTVTRFPILLKDRISKRMLVPDLSCEDTRKYLCSLMILENCKSDYLLDQLLVNRSNALLRDFVSSNEQNQTVKDVINKNLQIVSTTLTLVYRCFIERESPDNLQKYLATLNKSKQSINLVHLDHTYINAMKYIPLIVKNFNVTLNNDLFEEMDVLTVRTKMLKWLDSVKEVLSNQAQNIFLLVSTLKSFKLIRQSCQVYSKISVVVKESLNLPRTYDLWTEFYESQMTARLNDVLCNYWNSKYDSLKRDIDLFILQPIDLRKSEEEFDLHSIMWQTNSYFDYSDEKNKNELKKDLLVKIEGQFSKSVSLCLTMEKDITTIMQDVLDFVEDLDCETIPELQNFQSYCCFHYTMKIVNYLGVIKQSKNLCWVHCAVLAKFLSGISTLCPSLRKCVYQVSEWNTLKSKLNETSKEFWNHWITFISPDITVLFDPELNQSDNCNSQIKIMPKWNTFTTEVTNEDDEVVQSVVKVPCCVSVSLQEVLNKINVTCSRVLPPKPIINDLVLNVIDTILVRYDEYCQQSFPQVYYIQFMFDIMYLISLLIPVECQAMLSKCQNTISNLELKIDPFELDAISQYLMSNVKLCVNKSQAVYGLIAMNKTNAVVDGAPGADDANILNFSSQSVPWFPLLPVTTSYSSSDGI